MPHLAGKALKLFAIQIEQYLKVLKFDITFRASVW